MTDDIIKVSPTETNFLTRWPRHVCGGRTYKEAVLAEGVQDLGPSADGKGRDYRTVRVCDQCLEGAEGTIDERLELYASRLDAEAEHTRALIGRLQVPSFAELEAARRAHDAAWAVETFRSFAQ